jgi:hypothetical protein
VIVCVIGARRCDSHAFSLIPPVYKTIKNLPLYMVIFNVGSARLGPLIFSNARSPAQRCGRAKRINGCAVVALWCVFTFFQNSRRRRHRVERCGSLEIVCV